MEGTSLERSPGVGAAMQDRSTVFTLRRVGLEDRGAARAMHRRCSARSLRRRYLAAVGSDLERVVDRLVPPARGVALGAFAPHGDCVGLAHLLPTPDREVVELAVLVEDNWQRRGLGLRLSEATLSVPEREGRSALLLAQAENSPALATARRLGYRAIPKIANSVMEMTIEAPPPPGRSGPLASWPAAQRG